MFTVAKTFKSTEFECSWVYIQVFIIKKIYNAHNFLKVQFLTSPFPVHVYNIPVYHSILLSTSIKSHDIGLHVY